MLNKLIQEAKLKRNLSFEFYKLINNIGIQNNEIELIEKCKETEIIEQMIKNIK